jgi:predicted MPP superfamily phosphohydrolase
VEWIRGLAALEPDLVVNTGDNLAHPDAIPMVLEALGPLLSLPGAFVFGSNDYYAPRLKNPGRYLGSLEVIQHDLQHDQNTAAELPWRDLQNELRDAGWLDLNNARGELVVNDRMVTFAGVDDPHLGRDQLRLVGGRADPSADVAIGVMHAPYRRVLDAFTADRYQLLLAGHTHGGQLCIPGIGALVTNCDLEPRRAKGVSRHPDACGCDAAWLHVSAGLGTSPFAPVRFACPPEVSLLTLIPAD